MRKTHKKWQLAWNGNFPMTLAESDVFTRKGFNMSATAIYRLQSVSAGLEYVFNPDPTRSYADTRSFSYSEETKWNNFRNLVALKFTCYFCKGKSRDHAGKRISNADRDSGLTGTNTAK